MTRMKRRSSSPIAKRSRAPWRRRWHEIGRILKYSASGWPELAELGGFAEAYAHADPASALVKLRLFAENLTKDIYRDLRLPKPDQPTFVDLLKNHAFVAITPKVVLDKLHALRIHGNKAAHGEQVEAAKRSLAFERGARSRRAGCSSSMAAAKPDRFLPFKQPKPPQAAQAARAPPDA